MLNVSTHQITVANEHIDSLLGRMEETGLELWSMDDSIVYKDSKTVYVCYNDWEEFCILQDLENEFKN